MKHVTLLLPFLAFGVSLPIAAQESEEGTIRAVIEGETAAIRMCDFAKWADHWWHEPYASFTVTWPSWHLGLSGWDDVAAWAKRNTDDCIPNEVHAKKYDYKYKISGAMAFVTFLEDEGNESTRVLEKRDGRWKLVRMGVIGTTTYQGLAQRQELDRLTGIWQADLASLEFDVPVPFEVTELTLEFQSTATGLSITDGWQYTQAGDSWRFSGKAELAYDAVAGEMGAFVIASWSSGFSRAGLGKATYADGVLKVESSMMGDPSEGDQRREYSWKAGNVLHMRTVNYDADDNPQFVMKVDFIRNGWRGT